MDFPSRSFSLSKWQANFNIWDTLQSNIWSTAILNAPYSSESTFVDITLVLWIFFLTVFAKVRISLAIFYIKKPRRKAQKNLIDKVGTNPQIDENNVPQIAAPDHKVVIPDQVLDEDKNNKQRTLTIINQIMHLKIYELSWMQTVRIIFSCTN